MDQLLWSLSATGRIVKRGFVVWGGIGNHKVKSMKITIWVIRRGPSDQGVPREVFVSEEQGVLPI
jgi:hypothetical protein